MVTDIVSEIVKKELGEVSVSLSSKPGLCDFQINDAFRLAKELHKAPADIASEMVDKLKNSENSSYYFESISFVNGFVNITLSNKFINDLIKEMNSKDKFGISLDNKKVVLDYGGPNVAKPLHVGHMRTAIVGEAIKRICKYKGNDTIADTHLGDYGLQIGEVIYAMKHDNVKPEDCTLEYLNEAYPRMSALVKTDDKIMDECANITKDLQEGNAEYESYLKVIKEISVSDIRRLYNYLDVSFDLWEGESDAYQYIKPVEDILNKEGLLHESEGALVVDVNEDSDTKEIPPLIFKKSNGAYLYGTSDVSTIYERESKFQPDNILYVVDNRQDLHFKQVFRTVKKAGISDAKLEFLGYGTVNGEDGKPYKTRSGDTPHLDDLFKETKDIFISKKDGNESMDDEDIRKIVNAILKFADLQNNRVNDYIFDINKFSNVVGKTGPYMLYTVLRLKKIIKEFNNIDDLSDNIYDDTDRNLRFRLITLSESFDKAYNNRLPNYLVDYLYDLAVDANNFYQNNHVIGCDDRTKQEDWVYILNVTVKVLEEMLHLVGIDIPSYM